jgi:hypothetical protein
MRNFDLTDYQITVDVPVTPENPSGSRGVTYKVRESAVNLLFNPELKLGGLELLKQDALARKILNSEGDAVLLEEEEYRKVRAAIESFRGFTRNDVEFVRRVLECRDVKVQAIT